MCVCGCIVFVMDEKSERLVQEYMLSGATYEQACAMAGVDVPEEVGSRDDDVLIEENGRLAIRAINAALKRGTSGAVDNTVLTAAVRAVSMLEEQRKRGRGSDPEDDMLRWVADLNRRERERRMEVLQSGKLGDKVVGGKSRRVK